MVCLYVDRKDPMKNHELVMQEKEERIIGVVFLEKWGEMGSVLNKSTESRSIVTQKSAEFRAVHVAGGTILWWERVKAENGGAGEGVEVREET